MIRTIATAAFAAAMLGAIPAAIAQEIPELEGATEPKLEHDSSTNNLIRRYRKQKEPSS